MSFMEKILAADEFCAAITGRRRRGNNATNTLLLRDPNTALSELPILQPPFQVPQQSDDPKVEQQLNERARILQKLQLMEDDLKDPSLMSFWDEEDICPTCLDGFDPENPKINTDCGHHFHLACILEWAERQETCPMCDKKMVF
ncbi:hypothetical protein L7F22_008068 [Adiantum nelumboides]|nr:hypothetical protein [Adiantum nelumboides]